MKKFDVFAFVCLLCGTFQLALMTAGFEVPEGRELVFHQRVVEYVKFHEHQRTRLSHILDGRSVLLM